MKKLFTLTFITLFVGLAAVSCNSKTEKTTTTDSTVVDSVAVDTTVTDTTK
jgi:hypothetical protein